MDFKNVPKKYRPIPFWSWNERLDTEETTRQVDLMHGIGMGGFFMHARGGLETEYMGEEWFDNVEAAITEAERLGMYPWAYDENGWPSGFGSGAVNGLGVEYQQKYLRMEEKPEHTDTQIAKSGDHYFYYEINPFYVDTLDSKVIAEFIRLIYEPYYARFGNRIAGFFTDEPQISRNGIPWSFVMPTEYEKRYHEDLLAHLEELYLPVGDYQTTRMQFWKMVTELFSENYMKQIYDWCEAHGMKLTGHLLGEEVPLNQVYMNGACMPHYEYFHIPGMDWLGRPLEGNRLTSRQLSSVAEQLGKEAVLSETFASCGHNASLAELKGLYQSQMVRGINLLCQHLEGYSMRGIRKRDYPPAMYYQQPWWSEYDKWIEAMSRVGMVLANSEAGPDVLLIHPETTAWVMYDNLKNEGFADFHNRFWGAVDALEQKHVLFHLGDEIIMERHGRVENGKLIIGKQAYTYVIDELCEVLLPHTKALLAEFRAQGGQIISLKDVEAVPVVDVFDGSIVYTKRYLEGRPVHYLVNTTEHAIETPVRVQGKELDIYSGERKDFYGVHRFEPWGSLMVIEEENDCTGDAEAKTCADTVTKITEKSSDAAERADTVAGEAAPRKCTGSVRELFLDGTFKVSPDTLNALTLDRCDYYFDGELQEKDAYVLDIVWKANEKVGEKADVSARKIHLRQEYHVQMQAVPEKLYLITETPWLFDISINGVPIDKTVIGYYRDKSFKQIDIASYIQTGENLLTFEYDYEQSEETYENIRKSWIFESEKNKLTFDMEIEPIYLLGTFSVVTEGKWTYMDNADIPGEEGTGRRYIGKGWRYEGGFKLDAPKEQITLGNIQKQGFPFFCGELELTGELEVPAAENMTPILQLDFTGVNAVRLEIGDRKHTIITEDRISLAELAPGKYPVKLTLINNLRNLLGPHHMENGELYSCGPTCFYHEATPWRQSDIPLFAWSDAYHFVTFGRENER